MEGRRMPEASVTIKVDLGGMYDVLAEIWDVDWRTITDQEVTDAFNSLSEATKHEAYRWGTDDTVFRDCAYGELKDKPRKLT